MDAAPVVIILVAGFLGVGKTTLLHHALKNNEGLRIAVIRNEFSDMEEMYEAPLLLDDVDTESFSHYMELPNRCVCCTAKSKLVDGIDALINQIGATSKPFDLLLIEVSGLTDPLLVSEDIMNMEPGRFPVDFRGTATVVDAELLLKFNAGESCSVPDDAFAEFSELFTKQIISANLCLVNKMDLVNIPEEGIKKILRDTGMMEPVVCTENSRISIRDLIGLMNNEVTNRPGDHSCSSKLDISCYRIQISGNVDIHLLRENLNSYLWDMYSNGSSDSLIYRGKGIANGCYEIQIVRETVVIKELKGGLHVNRSLFLLIGKLRDENVVRNLLQKSVI